VKHGKQLACLGVVLAMLAACDAKDPRTGQSAGSTSSRSVRLLTQRLANIAGRANQAAPADIDEDTRLEGVKAGPGLILTSTYTLVNSTSESMNSTTFETKLTPVVKDASCANPDLRPLIDQGVVVVLDYLGNDGRRIGTVNINRQTCAAVK